MADVRPDEVSAILREQLSNFKSEAELEEVGTVLQVGDGVARIYGLSKAQSGELLEFDNGLNALVLNLEEDNVGAVLLGDSAEIKEGDGGTESAELKKKKKKSLSHYEEYEDDKVNFIMEDEGELSMGMRGNENYDYDVLSDDGHI